MRNNALEEISALIEGRFRDPDFCVKTICRDMGTSMSMLHELLSVRFGTTPHTLIEKRRLMEALALMELNHSTLGAIARACGFSSMRTFRRVFKKRLGVPPSEANERLRISSEKDLFYRECVRKFSEIGESTFAQFLATSEKVTGDSDRMKSILPQRQSDDNFLWL
jgi:AraC-like DNA-binding protein